MGGSINDTVRLHPYTNKWERLFEEEKSRLLAVIGGYVLEIQHVGSTSIPGMVAKPIIDIAIAVENFEKASVCIEPIVHLGYEYKGEYGISRRHFFVKGDPRTHHIHMNEISSSGWRDQIYFRNYLIRHGEIAKEYSELKALLAQRYPDDRQTYQNRKAPFIQGVLRLGRLEENLSE